MLKMSNEKPHHVVGFLLYRYGAEDIPHVFLNLAVILGGAVGLHRPEGILGFPKSDHVSKLTGSIGEIANTVLFGECTLDIVGLHQQIAVALQIQLQAVGSEERLFLSVAVEGDGIFAEDEAQILRKFFL